MTQKKRGTALEKPWVGEGVFPSAAGWEPVELERMKLGIPLIETPLSP
jgi:hypothetical protein